MEENILMLTSSTNPRILEYYYKGQFYVSSNTVSTRTTNLPNLVTNPARTTNLPNLVTNPTRATNLPNLMTNPTQTISSTRATNLMRTISSTQIISPTQIMEISLRNRITTILWTTELIELNRNGVKTKSIKFDLWSDKEDIFKIQMMILCDSLYCER